MTALARLERSLAMLALAFFAMAPAHPALALSPGIALVIGVDSYAGEPANGQCVEAATALRNRLRGEGFTVETLLDPQTVALREAIDDFAAQLSGAPSGTTLIYLCGDAVVDGTRLFMLPAGVEPRSAEPQTDGVVAQALLNALAGTGGTLYGDLALPQGMQVAPAIVELGGRLPPGLHVVLATREPAPLIGRRLAGGLDPTTGWNAIASTLATTIDRAPNHALAFVPPWQAPPPSPVGPPAAVPPHPPPLAPQTAVTTPTPTPGFSPVRRTARPSITGESAPAAASRNARSRRRAVEHERQNGSARVARLQDALSRLGYYRGPSNGEIDEPTLVAIRAFQRKLGDPETGIMTAAEVVRLLNS